MPTITTLDGNDIYYKDWGTGQLIVFSHGWPLSADSWDDQMFFLAGQGYRCIAHDRRGHGRSSQSWTGNDLDTYADDLAAVVTALNLKDAIHVGHSTGGGEVARYIGRHGTARVSRVVLISAATPIILKTEANPNGLPPEALQNLLGGMLADRSQFFKELSVPFYGANRPGAKVSDGIRESFWVQAMMAGLAAVYGSVKSLGESDFTADLKEFDVPTLVLHGDDDQIVPIDISGRQTVKLVKGARLVEFKGAPHGMFTTHKDLVNAELLKFFQEDGAATDTKREKATAGRL